MLRVELTRFSGPAAITLSSTAGARLLGPDGRELASGPGAWTVSVDGDNAEVSDDGGAQVAVLASGDEAHLACTAAVDLLTISLPPSVAGPRHDTQPAPYRGTIDVRIESGKLLVVNEVDLESYLCGVVPAEMGARAPIEALKAQAVASRTFALYHLGKWPEYDLRDSTDSQLYNGKDAETPETNAAVTATRGEVLTLGGRLIPAQFSTDCGGVTAPGAGAGDCPGVVNDSAAHRLADRPDTWSLSLSSAQLAARLGHAFAMNAGETITDLRSIKHDASGRVTELAVTVSAPPPQHDDGGAGTPSGTAPPRGGLPARAGRTDLRAAARARTIEIGGDQLRMLVGPNTLRSTLFTVQRDAVSAFDFAGAGWGHGHGMCQIGAMALAAAPDNLDYRAILAHYYVGATVVHVGSLGPVTPHGG